MQYYSDFSPVVKHGIPYRRGTSAYVDWLKEQIIYIQKGYDFGGTHITGRFYFLLNFFKLLHTNEQAEVKYEELISPYLADAKKELYDEIDDCELKGDDAVVIKGRDKGLSYDFAAISLHETQFYPNTAVCGIFPGGESPALKNFKAKYDEGWNNLLSDLRSVAGLGDSKQYYKYGREITLPSGEKEERGLKSSLTLLKAVNANVAKSGRYKFMFIDEIGEIPILTDLITTNYANMRKGKFKFGFTIAAGTTNSFGAAYAPTRDLYFNCKDYGFRKILIPAQRAYWGFVNYETGKSDEKGALEHIMAERKRLEGKTDQEGRKKLTIHKQNYPTNEKEAFSVATGSPYDGDLISNQILRIMTDKTIQRAILRGNIYPKKTEKGEVIPEFHETPDGKWLMFQRPEKNLFRPDVGGVDSFRMSNVSDSDSKGAIVMYRPFQGVGKIGNLPICIYHHRPKDKETFFEDCWLTALFYNSKMLIERTDEDIFKFFLERKAAKYMKEKPKLVYSPWSKATYPYGVQPTEHNKGVAAEYSVTEFNKNHADIVFVELLDELLKFDFGITNTDLADAYHWAVLHAMDGISVLPEHREQKITNKFGMPYEIEDAGGNRIVVNSQEKHDFYLQTNGN